MGEMGWEVGIGIDIEVVEGGMYKGRLECRFLWFICMGKTFSGS